MRHRWLELAGAAVASLLVAACGGNDATPTATEASTGTPTITATAAATETPTATATATVTLTTAPSSGTALGRQTGGGTCDALYPRGLVVGQAVEDVFVCIEAPAPGASVGSHVTVSGFQAGAFEQNVGVEVRDASGTALARTAATANAPDIGLIAGAWTVELDVSGTPASIAAFAESPRDGSIDFGGAIEVTP
jgi:hypothetical protein